MFNIMHPTKDSFDSCNLLFFLLQKLNNTNSIKHTCIIQLFATQNNKKTIRVAEWSSCVVWFVLSDKGETYNEPYLFTCLESGRACLISSFLDSIIITRNNVPRVRFFFKFSLTSNNRTSFSVRKTYLFHTAFLNYLLSI